MTAWAREFDLLFAVLSEELELSTPASKCRRLKCDPELSLEWDPRGPRGLKLHYGTVVVFPLTEN